MKHDEASILREHEINPSAQRIAVARYVLHTDKHPSADEVWTKVKKRYPHISRATVYNTLNLFVEKGLPGAHRRAHGLRPPAGPPSSLHR